LLEHLVQRTDLQIGVFKGWPNSERPDGRVMRALHLAGKMAWTQILLPLRLNSFDVLHSPAFIAPIASPCPKVITIHDVTYLLYPSYFNSPWLWYMKSVMPATVKSAAAIICGSEHSRQDIARAYSLAPERIHAIPYGVDHQRFSPAAPLDQQWARAIGIRGDYVLHVGEISHRKNIPTLLRAIAQLRSRGKWNEMQLVLAGPDNAGMPGADEVRKTIKELDLASSVVLAGHVPDDHLSGLYSQARLLVMPSFYEGFGFPVLESMAAGTPVVASNTSSLPEVAGEAAILVSPSDELGLAGAIADVLGSPVAAADLRARGLVRAQKFSWQRTAAATMTVYRAVAG
jgi:glycosyltransferase involved in cell wall biosynthesis